MVTHVVAFGLRADLSGADRQALMDAFTVALREIPVVRSVRIARRVTHGATYEQQMPTGFDYLVALDFDDLADLHAYLRHPAHADLGARFNQAIASGVVLDYELGGLDEFIGRDHK